MSNAILTWVKKKKAGSPSAKAVLMVLADEASTHGECWTSQGTLAEETEQSVDSVQRRLRDLERRGLIYCVKKRHWEDSGKWRTNMIVVLADSICVAFALKHGYDPAEVVARDAEEDLSPVSEVVAPKQDDADFAVPQIADSSEGGVSKNKDLAGGDSAAIAADCGMVEKTGKGLHRTAPECGTDRTALLRYENPNLRTISPLKPPEPSPAAALEGDSWLSSWQCLVDAWPWKPDELHEPVRRKFRELEPDDRKAALEWIPAYLDEVRRKQGKPMSARRWVGFRGWEPFALAAKKVSTAKPGSEVFVFKGTPAFEAWRVSRGKPSLPTVTRRIDGKIREGWTFPTLWPPGRMREEEAQQEQGDVR